MPTTARTGVALIFFCVVGLLSLVASVAAFSKDAAHEAATNERVQWQHDGADANDNYGQQLLSRDDTELLMSVNEAYEPWRNGTSMNLFENLMALVDQMLALRRGRLVHYDPVTGLPVPYRTLEEAEDDLPDDEVSTARETNAELDDEDVDEMLDGDEAYAPFLAVLAPDARYIHQPKMRRQGLVSVVDGLVDDAEERLMAQPENIVSVQFEVSEVRRQGVQVVRLLEMQRYMVPTAALSPQGVTSQLAERRLLDVYFIHVREVNPRRAVDTPPAHDDSGHAHPAPPSEMLDIPVPAQSNEWASSTTGGGFAPPTQNHPPQEGAAAKVPEPTKAQEWRIHLIERMPTVINPIKF